MKVRPLKRKTEAKKPEPMVTNNLPGQQRVNNGATGSPRGDDMSEAPHMAVEEES